MEKSLKEYFKEELDIKDFDIKTYSPLSLAYIGDAVYEIIIRTIIVTNGNAPVNKYHKQASALVKAEKQAEIIERLERDKILTDDELSIYKRGRNAKSFTTAKNASVIDYRKATGFEALIGYLYLVDNIKRIIELVKIGIE